MRIGQNSKEIGNAGIAPEVGVGASDLQRAPMTNINQQHNFQELLQGAIGAKDADRLTRAQNIPEHAADRAVMLRNADIVHLGKYFGDQPAVQGVIAGIALSADQFEIRQAAIFAVVSHNQSLADLTIGVSLSDSDARIREKMLLHLSQEDPLFATSAAVRIARNDPVENLRIGALELLLDLDTAKAVDLAHELVSNSHNFDKFRDFCRRTVERTDLDPYVKETGGHLISQESEHRAALLSAALFEDSPDLCLKAADQFLARAGEAEAVTLGFALLSHRSSKLQDYGNQTLMIQSGELAGMLNRMLTRED